MTMKLSLNNLTSRMLIGIIILQIILLPIVFGGLLYIVKKGYEAQFIDHARSDAYILSNTITEALNFSIFDDAFLSGRISFAKITDSNNKVLYSSEGDLPVNNFLEDFYFGQHNDSHYNLSIPLDNNSNDLTGVLHISYDESSTQDQIYDAYKRSLYFSLFYILISALLTVMLGRRLTKPIEHLREQTREIAHGQFHQEITVKTEIKELCLLAETLEFMRDELVTQTESMEHQALHDSLTGLPNRALLHDRVDQALFHPFDALEKFSLALIDLDRFKEINDSFGHLTGDNVLMEVAARLRHVVRRGDTVTRLGGDEFAILLPTADQKASIHVTEKMLQSLLEPINIDKYSLRIGASIGIVNYPDHGDCFEALLGNADIAMYAAKQSGGGIKVFSQALSKDTFKKLTLASDLRVAVEEKQFFTVFQPKLNIKTGLAHAAEALVRWNHPEKGLISPVDFIPIAERTGIISGITKCVLEDVIEKLSHWLSMGYRFSVSVNLSAHDLENENLPELIVDTLKKHNVPPEHLELEITESAIITDPLRAFDSLKKLHNIGIKIALDDFGTGYSSLAQLRRLPLSIIKIDRSFIFGMTTNDSDVAIVRATIGMAHDLGLKVVAEGPEDKQSMKALKELNCDYAQGYYVSKPLKADDFISWIDKNHHKQPMKKNFKPAWLRKT